METLRKIIDAEKEAARLLSEAEALREGSDERLREGSDALLLRYKDMSDSALAEAEKAERERADAAVSSLTEDTNARVAVLRKRFGKDRERYADELFVRVLGENDDQ